MKPNPAPGHRLHSRSLVALLALATVAASFAVVSEVPAAGAESCQGRSADYLLVPSCGAWLGSTDRHVDRLDVGTQESVLGSQLDLVRIYKVGPGADFFGQRERGLVGSGHRLVYSWKVTTTRTDIAPWRQVARGDHDAALRRVAQQIASSGTKVIFGLHHEPEDNVGSFGTTDDYVAMYRHAYDVMEPIAGNNLVWFINYMGHSYGGFDRVAAMYPGDDIIDWISYNPYNWHGCHIGAPWRSFEDQARPFYRWAQNNHPNKPLMIGETASNELPGDGAAKARWVDAMGSSLSNNFPAIRAVLWFHQSQNSGFCDRRWDSSASSVEAFKRLRSNPYFGGRQSGGTGPATPPPSQPGSNDRATSCWTSSRNGGANLRWNSVANATSYVYRLETGGSTSYGELGGTSANITIPPGQTARLFLSAKYSDGSYSPAGDCGIITAGDIRCSAAAQPGGITAGWTPVPGAAAYVYEIAIEGQPKRYRRVDQTWAFVPLPAGTSAQIRVAASFDNGSYSNAAACGSATSGA